MTARLSPHRRSCRADATRGTRRLAYVGELEGRRSRAWTVVGAFTCLALMLVSRAVRGDGVPEHEKIAIVTAHGTSLVAFSEELDGGRDRERAYEWAAPNPSPGRRNVAPRFPARYPLFLALLVGIAQTVVIVLGLGCAFIQICRMPSSSSKA